MRNSGNKTSRQNEGVNTIESEREGKEGEWGKRMEEEVAFKEEGDVFMQVGSKEGEWTSNESMSLSDGSRSEYVGRVKRKFKVKPQ